METKIDEIGDGIFRLSSWVSAVTPQRLALMHDPSFGGDGAAALHALADDYGRRLRDRTAAMGGSASRA